MLPFPNVATNFVAAQTSIGNPNVVQAEYIRVSVKDGSGTYRDLTTYPGFNALKSVHWSEKVDDPHATFDITLLRDQFKLNLSPFVAASPINKGFNPAGSGQLIALNREVKIEVAVCAMDKQPVTSDWALVFHGRVDTLDAGHPEEMTFGGRSLGGRLSQQFIKTEYVYSYAVVSTLPVRLRIWEPNMVVTTADYVLPASRGDNDPGLNKFLKCSLAGTTGTTEPVWTTGAGQVDGTAHWDYVGAPTTSGTDVEKVMQNILDDNRLSGDPAVTLHTPVSPAWAIKQFIQEREFTWDAISALAHQIGWDVRYKWDGLSDFQLTFDQPNRAFIVGSDDPNWLFQPSEYLEPKKLALDISMIRNSIRVVYSDRADLWPDGTPKRKTIEVQDSASITQYGELWMEMQEDENGNIDSSTEASALANAALSDCSQPTAELSIELIRGFPWVELNDMHQYVADGRRFDSDLTLAVTSYSHVFEGGKLKTTLELRGLPTIGAAQHIERGSHPSRPVKGKNGHGPQHKIQHFQGTKTPAQVFTETVGGVKITTKGTIDKQRLLDEYEVHISKTPGFTPDSTTIIGTTKAQLTEHGDLDSGDTYYGCTVPRWWNTGRLVRGQPSALQSFVPGYLKPKHINTELFRGEMPINGSFEGFTRIEGQTVPPDNWEIGAAGVWGTDITAGPTKGGADAANGGKYIRWTGTNNVAASVRSKWFPVNGSNVHQFNAWLYRVATDAGNVDMQVEWVTATKAAISTTTFTVNINTFTSNTWNFLQKMMSAPATAAFARVILTRQTAANYQFYFDGVSLVDAGPPWIANGATGGATFGAGWSNLGSPDQSCAIRRNAAGRVFIKGEATSATNTTGVGNKILTLPSALFPAEKIHRATTANLRWAGLVIDTSGNLFIEAADSATYAASVSIDCAFDVFS